MNKPLVLVVEDDRPIRNLIVTTLKAHDYHYLTAENGHSAIIEATSHNPDIVLLDLGLPDIDGTQAIESIRSWSNMPIIVISARSEDKDKITALDAGADDYLTKPFAMEELLARIRSLSRRVDSSLNDNSLKFSDISLNLQTYELSGRDGSLSLGLKEFSIMEYLLNNPNKVISKELLIEKIWGYDSDAEYNNVEVYISFLRKKLRHIHSATSIKTVRGVGYRLEES